jgi:hypothetical protein
MSERNPFALIERERASALRELLRIMYRHGVRYFFR